MVEGLTNAFETARGLVGLDARGGRSLGSDVCVKWQGYCYQHFVEQWTIISEMRSAAAI